MLFYLGASTSLYGGVDAGAFAAGPGCGSVAAGPGLAWVVAALTAGPPGPSWAVNPRETHEADLSQSSLNLHPGAPHPLGAQLADFEERTF